MFSFNRRKLLSLICIKDCLWKAALIIILWIRLDFIFAANSYLLKLLETQSEAQDSKQCFGAFIQSEKIVKLNLNNKGGLWKKLHWSSYSYGRTLSLDFRIVPIPICRSFLKLNLHDNKQSFEAFIQSEKIVKLDLNNNAAFEKLHWSSYCELCFWILYFCQILYAEISQNSYGTTINNVLGVSFNQRHKCCV